MSSSSPLTVPPPRVKAPPNILILAENENDFQTLRSYLISLIGHNAYTIYKISYTELAASSTWMANCSLLVTIEQYEDKVLSESNLERRVLNLKGYLQRGGRILSLPSLNEDCEQLTIDSTKIVSYVKSYFYFEFFYDRKFGLDKQLCRLNGDELNARGLFYSYASDQFKGGVHFVSRVRQKTILLIDIVGILLNQINFISRFLFSRSTTPPMIISKNCIRKSCGRT
jgi:hypothetical protein